jgi:hypothetical protein
MIKYLTLFLLFANVAFGAATIFPAPSDSDVPASTQYTLTADGNSVFVYGTWRHGRTGDHTQTVYGRISEETNFVIFDFTGSVEVVVYSSLITTNAYISPKSASISPSISNGVSATFTLTTPGNYIFHPDANGDDTLCLFTSVPETNVPTESTPKTRYYPAGVHHLLESINLEDNETLYLAGGAVLLINPDEVRLSGTEEVNGYTYTRYEAMVRAEGKRSVTIRGRGVISGKDCFDASKIAMGIYVEDVDNCVIDGITIYDTSKSPIQFIQSRNIDVDNLRTIAHFNNSGGVVCSGAIAGEFDNSFFIAADDGVDLKSNISHGPTCNLFFNDVIVWSIGGSTLGVVIETAHNMHNITFRDIIIPHYDTYRDYSGDAFPRKGMLNLNPGRGGLVKKILFEDITIEESQSERPLIMVSNMKYDTNYVPDYTDEPYSLVDDLKFKNIVGTSVNTDDIILDAHTAEDFTRIVIDSVSINSNSITSGDVTIREESITDIIVR